MDIGLIVLGCIASGIAGGWLGRKAQRKYWLLDRPYAERVAALRLGL